MALTPAERAAVSAVAQLLDLEDGNLLRTHSLDWVLKTNDRLQAKKGATKVA